MLAQIMNMFRGKNSAALASVSNWVKQEIAKHDVLVFSKTYCPYCTMAKQALLREIDQSKIHIIELDNRNDGSDIQAVLGEITGEKTVPRVFLKGKCIGGGSETDQLQRSGELKKLLHSINAA